MRKPWMRRADEKHDQATKNHFGTIVRSAYRAMRTRYVLVHYSEGPAGRARRPKARRSSGSTYLHTDTHRPTIAKEHLFLIALLGASLRRSTIRSALQIHIQQDGAG